MDTFTSCSVNFGISYSLHFRYLVSFDSIDVYVEFEVKVHSHVMFNRLGSLIGDVDSISSRLSSVCDLGSRT